MDQMSWKMSIVTMAVIICLTSGVVKESMAGALIDVCATCHVNATCDDKMDGSGGKVCNCMYGFLGNGRTQCKDKDECQAGSSKICGDHTVCHNTYGSFYCTCLRGYSPSNNLAIFIPNDGTYCNDIDECKVKGICGEGGWCINGQGDFSCRCQHGYTVQDGSQPFHPHHDKAFCKAIDCGQPPSASRASLLSVTGTRYGSVAKFGCLEGFFHKSGNDTATCGIKGVWEGPNLVCEEINCGEPPGLTHTVMIWNKCSKMGSKVYYKCVAGYYNVGKGNVSVCTARGEWDKASVQCEEIECGHPPIIPHLVMQWDGSMKVGSIVYYACQEGFYKTEGRNESVCTVSGQWWGVSLSCKEIDCGQPPSIPHSIMVWNNSTRMGTEVYYECTVGFYNAGYGNVSACKADGYWDDTKIHCAEINCGPPAIIPNTDMDWDNTTGLGSVVHYTCKYGFYQESGISQSTCTSSRQWDDVTVMCKEIDCGKPPALPHSAFIWSNSTKIDTEVYYKCNIGFYYVSGWNISICTANGFWDGATLLCQEIDCGRPILIPHASILWDRNTRMGSIVYYNCDEGYYSVNEKNHAVCGENGLWEDIAMRCEEINCGPPAVIPNTDMHWDNTAGLGSMVRYTCKEGFHQESGISQSTCTSARQWEHVTVTCKASCGPAPSLPHSDVEWQNGSIAGSVALHRCRRGYWSRRGGKLSICADAGKWQVATLFCRAIKSAISKPAVFNDNCLRWKTEISAGEEEHYTVQFVGSRDYQHTFQDKRKKSITSAAEQSELCLNLLPGTNYTINITALSSRFSAVISANTSIKAPPAPEVVFRVMEVPLPSLWLRRSANTLDPISVYQVFVVPLEGIVVFDCRSPSTPHFQSQSPTALYVAAVIPVMDIGRELSFTLGDQLYYGDYYNAPLQPGRDYYVILRAVNQWGKVRKQTCVIWAKARGTSYIIQSVTLITGGLISLVAFVIFLGHSCVWYCKKK